MFMLSATVNAVDCSNCNLANFHILATGRLYFEMKIKEALYLNKFKPSLNIQLYYSFFLTECILMYFNVFCLLLLLVSQTFTVLYHISPPNEEDVNLRTRYVITSIERTLSF